MDDAGVLRHAIALVRDSTRHGRGWLLDRIGGPARLHVILVLAAVLGLDGADKGTVSAAATNLTQVFGIGNTQIGLLVTASTLVGALATIPVGALTDRVRRTRLLAASILVWAAAMVLGAAAQSYPWLLLSRVLLGAVTATAGPTIASLTGDYFPARERARMYGFILAGELVGTGVGFVVSGWVAQHVGWRYAFGWLAIPSFLLVLLVVRLAEPARGGQSRIGVGQQEIQDERDASPAAPDETEPDEQGGRISEQVREREEITPYRSQILTEDPAGKSLWWAVRYILRIRTDVVIIIASALGYFYFAGLRTFAVTFAQSHYDISKTFASSLVLVIGLGGLAGVYTGGRTADRLLQRHVINARVVVPTVVLLLIPAVLAPAFWVTSLWIAVPLLTLGAGMLGAANPPQDAARLDIIHPHLWGRSEGVRSALRGLLEAAAPVTFGWVSDRGFGGKVSYGGSSVHGSQEGLSLTFLVFLVVLLAAGLIVMIALRTYPRDVATADASVRNTLERGVR